MKIIHKRIKDIVNLTKDKLLWFKNLVSLWGLKKTVLISVVMLVLITSLLWFTGVFSSSTPQVQATTAVVQRGDIRVVVSGTGTVSGVLEQNLVAKVGGVITSIGFTKGSRVKKGDILLTLDNPSVRQKLATSELNLKQSQFDYSQSAMDFNKLNVTAPFTGLITMLNVKEGDEVAKGAPLVTLVSNREMELTVSFNEIDAKKIVPGQTADVFLQEFLYTVPGRVTYVSSAAQPDQSGAVVSNVKIVIDNPGGLYSGIKSSATVHTASGDVRSLTQGALQYRNTSSITATAAGTVTKVFVQQNDAVEQGQKILEVKSDQAIMDVTAKQLKIQQARIDAEIAKEDYESLTIVAPFDGVLVSTGREVASSSSSSASTTKQELIVGDEVKAGDVVAKVANYDQMLVTIQVDETDIPKVNLGQKATITADALPNKLYKGEVVVIGAEGKTQNGVATFDVTIRIDHPDGLKAGMTVNADILVAEKSNVLLIPIEALQDRAGKKFVMLADSNDKKTTSSPGNSRREVQVGLNNETYVEIISGLKEGDQVIVPSVQKSNTNTNQLRTPIPGTGGIRPSGGTTRQQGR